MWYETGIIDLDIMPYFYGLILLWNLKSKTIKHWFRVSDDNLWYQLKGIHVFYILRHKPSLYKNALIELITVAQPHGDIVIFPRPNSYS